MILTRIGIGLAVGVIAALAIYFGIKKGWNFSEWLGVVGLAIAIPGFSGALVQIRGTKRAVDSALLQVESGRLADAINDMQHLVETIHDASEEEGRKAFRRLMSQWRRLAKTVVLLTDRRYEDGHSAIPLLQKSIRESHKTNRAIFEEGLSVENASGGFLTAIDLVSDELTLLKESLAIYDREQNG